MKRLRPLPLKQSYYKSIEREIDKIFRAVIFDRLFSCLPKELKNAVGDALYEAIESGVVYYEGGLLRGQFNARISKAIKDIGGTYNRKSNTFSVPDLPKEYITAQVVAQGRYRTIQSQLLTTLDQINVDEIDVVSNIPDEYVETIGKMDKDFIKATRSVAIAPSLTQEGVNTLAADWAYNLDLYIKKWTSENIIAMRNEISSNIMAGQRVGNLAKVIQSKYDQSKNKAKFLARQETALLMSKYHEQKYKSLGIQKYIWETSSDERVRQSHKELDGKVISWDNPPVVDSLTGRRAHAGEDFNCRCVAIAVVE